MRGLNQRGLPLTGMAKDARLKLNDRKTFKELKMSTMQNPPHPGRILKSTVLGEEGGLSVQALADRLKMTRTAVSRVVNGKAGISIEMAIRLEALLGTSAETW